MGEAGTPDMVHGEGRLVCAVAYASRSWSRSACRPGVAFAGRQVLISPISIQEPNWIGRTLPVSITMEKVRSSPDIDTHEPVSRQHESLYLQYYGYDNYFVPGTVPVPWRWLPSSENSGFLRGPRFHSARFSTTKFLP